MTPLGHKPPKRHPALYQPLSAQGVALFSRAAWRIAGAVSYAVVLEAKYASSTMARLTDPLKRATLLCILSRAAQSNAVVI